MRNQLFLIALLMILGAVVLGCGVSNKAANESIPMIVIDGGTRFYDGNDVIGTLPVGTEVDMIERKDEWYLVAVSVDDYDMKLKGLVSADALAPAPENASAQILAPAVSPVYEARREEVWQEFFADPYQLACARYQQNIERWRRHLKTGNALLLLYDDVSQRPAELLRETMRFLGVSDDPRYVGDLAERRVNPAGGSSIPGQQREFLEQLLADEIRQYRMLVGRV